MDIDQLADQVEFYLSIRDDAVVVDRTIDDVDEKALVFRNTAGRTFRVQLTDCT